MCERMRGKQRGERGKGVGGNSSARPSIVVSIVVARCFYKEFCQRQDVNTSVCLRRIEFIATKAIMSDVSEYNYDTQNIASILSRMK